ncbi:MAG: Gfo/Idh/MocA family oxidoreductase [Bryobacteraceae bacterium]|nr:Gfo/Idh/MocA family oxidoreductase [Bryobacteraceae bacterium]MDW8377927.1 Gfo/Idh/MocA family oxidoreductase [Bryobacterales bacterium]
MHPTRRNMLTSIALAPAATAAIRLPSKVRLGLLDLEGHVGEVIRPLEQLPDVEVVAIAHASAATVHKHQAANPRLASAKHYTDYRRMLESEKLDIVSVCTPNGPRAAAILDCLAHKVHVIAEKPLALNREDLEKIRRALVSAGTRLSTLLPMRFDSAYLALRRYAPEIGEVINISSQKSYKAGNRVEWMKRQSTYGGTIPWIGIHMIDLMRFTSRREMTEVFSYRAQIGAPPGIGEMENTTGSLFRLDNGGVATLHMDYCRPETAPTHGDDRLRLAGTKGVLEYMAATGVTLMTESRKPEVIRDLPPKQSVFIDFLEHVYNHKPTLLPFEEIYRANLITIAAQEAAVTGRVIRI